jgi:hypothetical protein
MTIIDYRKSPMARAGGWLTGTAIAASAVSSDNYLIGAVEPLPLLRAQFEVDAGQAFVDLGH